MNYKINCQPLIKDKDYLLYREPDIEGNIVECLHCHSKSKNQNYMKYQHREHCKELMKEGNDIRRYFHGSNEENDNEKLIAIVRCICQNCIPINATQSTTFRKLTKTSFSSETIRNKIINYAQELKNYTKTMIKNKFVSIVIDGATITTSGWYCVGLSTNSRVYYYDCYHLANGTTRCITEQLEEIISEIEAATGAKVIGACSDNASNVSNVFDPLCNESIIQLHKRYIIRVSCQAHTANLVLTSYEKNDTEFSQLRSRIRKFVRELHNTKIHELLGIPTRCPPIREQRWFTDYIALDWICKYHHEIDNGFKNIVQLMPCSRNPITNSWFELRDALAPLYFFTTNVECNMVPLGRSYELLTILKEKLTTLSGQGNTHAQKLLKFVIERWTTTADEPLLKLAYLLRTNNLLKWREKFNNAEKQTVGSDIEQSNIDFFNMLKEEAAEIVTLTIKYAAMMGYNLEEAKDEIKYLIHYAYPKYQLSPHNFWHELYTEAKFIKTAAERQEIILEEERIKYTAEFFSKMLSLPSTEAYCERVFKNMRELFSFNRQNCADDLIKAQTIIKMNIEMEKDNIENDEDLEY